MCVGRRPADPFSGHLPHSSRSIQVTRSVRVCKRWYRILTSTSRTTVVQSTSVLSCNQPSLVTTTSRCQSFREPPIPTLVGVSGRSIHRTSGTPHPSDGTLSLNPCVFHLLRTTVTYSIWTPSWHLSCTFPLSPTYPGVYTVTRKLSGLKTWIRHFLHSLSVGFSLEVVVKSVGMGSYV